MADLESLPPSPEQEPSLRLLVTEVRELGGITGETIMEEWDARRKKGAPLTEVDVQQRIDFIEKHIDALKYGNGLERSMFYAVRERLRLRLEMKHGRIDAVDQKDIEVLKDLGKRISYAQYEEAAVDEILDATEETEAYRDKYSLDRSDIHGPVERSTSEEKAIRMQLQDLKQLLPQIATVRKIRYYEFRLSEDPENFSFRQKIDALRATLSEMSTGESMEAYYGLLEQRLRTILNRTSDDAQGQKNTTPIALKYERETIDKHFDSILQQRNALLGKTSGLAERKKKQLSGEHTQAIEDGLRFTAQSVRRRARVIGLLTRSGIIDQPVADPATAKAPDRDYGLLGKRDVIANERDRNIGVMEEYLRHFRKNVLREDKRLDLPGDASVPLDPSMVIEDLMTTHMIPAKLMLAEPLARASTAPWVVQDMMLDKVGLHFDIRERRTQAILAPIYARLGLPENYSQLSDKEKTAARHSPVVQQKLKSVKKIIDEFYENEIRAIQALQNDLQTLRALTQKFPPEDLVLTDEHTHYAAMPRLESLNTPQDVLGAYIFLLHHIENDNMDALEKAQKKYLVDIKANLDLNLDISDIEQQLAKAWAREWGLSVAAILGEGFAGYQLVRRGIPMAMRSSPAVLRGTAKVVSGTTRQLGKLARSIGGGKAAEAGTAAEKVAQSTGRIAKVGRVLGPIGIVLLGVHSRRVMDRDQRLRELSKLDGITAAIELMETTKVDHKAVRYHDELKYLHARFDAVLMQQNALKLLAELEQRFPTDLKNKDAEALKNRCFNTEKFARKFEQEYKNLFPVTDYLVKDPEGEEDGVGVNVRDINNARVRGMEYEKEQSLQSDAFKLSRFFSIPNQPDRRELLRVKQSAHNIFSPEEFKRLFAEAEKGRPLDSEHSFEDLKQEHEKLLEDAADFLDTVPKQ